MTYLPRCKLLYTLVKHEYALAKDYYGWAQSIIVLLLANLSLVDSFCLLQDSLHRFRFKNIEAFIYT